MSQVFAANLSAARAAKGMSKRQLAQAAGIHPAQVTRYENGDQMPMVRQLRKLADALGVTSDDLIVGDF